MNTLGLATATLLSLTTAVDDPPGPTPPPPSAVQSSAAKDTGSGPRYKGTGLLATTGILAGTSLAMTIARSVLLHKNCPLSGMGGAKCSYSITSDIGLAASAWAVNMATIGMAAGAGTMLGRYHAWKDIGSGRKRQTTTIMAAGGSLVGVGIAGLGTSIALAFVLPAHCVSVEAKSTDPLSGDRCLMHAFPAWTMTNWASFAMISSGTAMLAYGSAHKRAARRMARYQFSPFAGRTYAGLGFSGRF